MTMIILQVQAQVKQCRIMINVLGPDMAFVLQFHCTAHTSHAKCARFDPWLLKNEIKSGSKQWEAE